MDSSSYNSWNNFFLSAGIPNGVSNEYAMTFSQHRIRMDMLKEITKEILLDMGIKAMGDIIAILRQAKNICTQNELKVGPKPSISTSTVGMSNNASLSSINSNPILHDPSQFTPSSVSNQVVSLKPLQKQQQHHPHNNHHQHQQPSSEPSANSVQRLSPQQPTRKPIAQRVSISTSRAGPTISHLVGSKIQSRVSMNSGVLTRRLGRIEKTNNNSKKKEETRNNKTAGTRSQQSQQLKSTVFARLGGRTR